MITLALWGGRFISVVIRHSLVMSRTPNECWTRHLGEHDVHRHLRMLGDFRAGLMATWFGAVPAVLIGGSARWRSRSYGCGCFPSCRRSTS